MNPSQSSKSQGTDLLKTQDDFYKAVVLSETYFEDQIEPIGALTAHQCLNIYRFGYPARLSEALGTKYESCWWVLGDEKFHQITESYIQANPSKEFDLDQYGNAFPEYIAKSEFMESLPFLESLAQFERLFMQVFHFSDMISEINWSEIATWGNFKLKLSPSARFFTSPYTVHEIWKLREEPVESASLPKWDQEESLLFYKSKSSIYIRRQEADEHLLFRSMSEGLSLLESLEKLGETFPQITPERVQELFGLISSIGVFSEASPA